MTPPSKISLDNDLSLTLAIFRLWLRRMSRLAYLVAAIWLTKEAIHFARRAWSIAIQWGAS
jgi:hypothetical protein